VVVNESFGTRPLIVHAQGDEAYSPHWRPIRERFFASPRQNLGVTANLTILTWNNHQGEKGIFERSLDHLGVPCVILGQEVRCWVNSRHKPLLAATALKAIRTDYVLGVDSWDAIALGDPRRLLDIFESSFSCELVFNAGKVNWPNLSRFREFERSLTGATESEFRYLNGGVWIGKTDFCRLFFAHAVQTEPAPEAPNSEQGILKQIFAEYYPRVQLDYRCEMFQTLQYVFKPILRPA
jgi:hypothetical protein